MVKNTGGDIYSWRLYKFLYVIRRGVLCDWGFKAMSHSHYVQFAHIPRMKFWSYMDIRGYTWNN